MFQATVFSLLSPRGTRYRGRSFPTLPMAHLPTQAGFGQRNAVFLKRPLTARSLAVWAESFAPVPEPGYDLTHSFNAVPVMTRRPFLVSYESFLPRFPDDHEHGAACSWRRAVSAPLLRGQRCQAGFPSQGGDGAEQDGRHDRDTGHHDQNGPVDANGVQPRQFWRSQ